jgi:hypothetical protein
MKTHENLSNLLEIDHQETPKTQMVLTEPAPVPVVESAESMDADEAAADFKKARKTINGLIDKGEDALRGIIDIAKESQHPKAYEAAANMLKSVSDMTNSLYKLHRQRLELRVMGDGRKQLNEGGGYQQVNNHNIEKAVFVGSTKDLLDHIKSQ